MKNTITFPLFCILLLTSIIITTSVFAQSSPAPEIKNYGLITPPVCQTSSGETIGIYPGTSEQIVQFGGFIAAAGDFEVGKDGGIVNEDRIYYDESNMPYLHPLLQKFFFHHECAHVTLDHIDIPPVKRSGMYWSLEQGADCQAFIDIKASSDDFERDANIILTNFKFIAERIMPAAAGQEDARAKFIDQRIENMLICDVFAK